MTPRVKHWLRETALSASPALLILAAGLLTLHNPAIPWNPASHPGGGDVWEYYVCSARIAAGQFPYRDFSLEYPPGAILAFCLTPWLTLRHSLSFPAFCVGWVVENAVLAALTGVVLGGMLPPGRLRDGGLLCYAILLTAFSPLLPWRFDQYPALLTLLALRALLTQKRAAAGAWLGLAAAAKLYPILLLPVFLLFLAAQGRRREALRLGLACLGAFSLCFAPFLTCLPAVSHAIIGYHQQRGLEFESLPGAILLIAHAWGGMPEGLAFNYGAFHLLSPASHAAARVMPLLFLMVYGGLLRLIARRFRAAAGDGGPLLLASAAVLIAFIVTSKVLSPQYLIWLVPITPLLAGRWRLGFGIVGALTILLYPYLFDSLLAMNHGTILLLNLRNVLLTALLGAIIRSLARAETAGRSETGETAEHSETGETGQETPGARAKQAA